MTYSNSMNEQEKAPNESDVLARLLKDFLAQTKADKPEKLLEDAYDYLDNLFSDTEKQLKFLQTFLLSPEKRLKFLTNLLSDSQKRLHFLQSVLLHSFHERLHNMNDDDPAKDASLSNDYVAFFDDLCKGKDLEFEPADRNNLKRNLEIERRAELDSRRPVTVPLQIISNDKRGLSSLGNLKGSRTVLQTQFEVSSQISNVYLTTANVSSPTRVTRPLGDQSQSSGQKDVFEGKQTETQQRVAVKSSRSEQNDQAVIHEAEIQASIAHQGVPTIISLNKSGVPVIVEPYIKGTSWASKIDTQTSEEKMNVLLQVGAVMTYAHREAKIVHGDLKPDNVMIDDYGQVYVIDWGYAIKLTDDEEKRIVRGSTEAYQPPEVCPPEGCHDAPQPATAAADVYMLGGILHQIVVPSKKTFNEAFLEAEAFNYKISQWKNRNKFPEIPDVSKEMREVLQKALAYKPENRYQDAGEFVDALKKYQKKYQTLRRFNENKERFAQCKTQAEETPSANKNGKEAARNRNDLIACVDEFSSIRKELEKIYDGPKQDASFFDVLSAELDARSFLLDRSINAQDFGQAQAIAETQEAVAALCQLDNQTSDFHGQITTELQAQRGRIAKGYGKRRRNNILAFSAGVLFVLLLLSFGLVALQGKQKALAENKAVQAEKEAVQAENKAKEAENKVLEERVLADEKAQRASNQQLFDIYQRNAQTAQDEKFGQGEISFWAKALGLIDPVSKEPSFPQCCNSLDVVSKTSILPQQISSFNPVVKSSGFSYDGSFFMFQDTRNNFTIWETETLQTVANVNLSFPAETTTYILANPCFEDEKSDDPVLASRFLLFNAGGDVWLVSNSKNEVKLTTYFSNVRNAANNARETEQFDSDKLIMNEEEFKKNLDVSFDKLNFTSCYIAERTAEGRALLFVGAETGEILTYTLPDFKLVGAFKTQNSIDSIEASITGKYVVIVDSNTNICRRYAFDGTLLNEYRFDFSSQDSSYGSNGFKIALSSSGKKMVAGNEQGSICVWDMDGDKVIAQTTNTQTNESLYSETPFLYWIDENRFLSLGQNNDCRIWTLEENESVGSLTHFCIDCGLPGVLSALNTASFSPVTKKLVLEGFDKKVRLIDIQKAKQVAQTSGITTSGEFFTLSSQAYLPGTNSLLIASCSTPYDSIKSIDAQSFEETQKFNPEPDKDFTMDWMETYKMASSFATPSVGSEFAVALISGEIVFFNAGDSSPIYTLKGFSSEREFSLTDWLVNGKNYPVITTDSNAKYLAGTTYTGDEIILWNWKTKKEIRRWKTSNVTKDSQNVRSDLENIEDEIVFDENEVSSDSVNETDSENEEISFDENDFSNSKSQITIGLCFIDDDKILEISYDRLNLWNALTGNLLNSSKVGTEDQFTYCFSPSRDGKMVALGENDGSVYIVSTEDFVILASLESAQAKLSNQNSDVYEGMRPKDKRNLITRNEVNSKFRTQVTGINWSQDDKRLCVAYSNGNARVFDISAKVFNITTGSSEFQIKVRTSFVVSRENELFAEMNTLGVFPIFTKTNSLITLDSNGSIQLWDYTPSQDSVTHMCDIPSSKLGVGNVKRQEWARFTPNRHSKKPFAIYSGKNLKCEIYDVCDFQYWNAPDGTNGYLTIHTSDGAFSFIDENTYKSVPSIIDERRGFPSNGLERFCISPDGTKIAGIEKVSYKTWILDLSRPDSKWDQVCWYDEEAHSQQLTFSPNSQILVAVDRDILRLWNIKANQELLQKDGNIFDSNGVTTSIENLFGLPIVDFGKIQFVSENLVVQTGLVKGFYIWDVKERSVFQEVPVQLIGEATAITACESLNKGPGEDKPTTFVIAGSDGVLRFYQLSRKTNQFELIYVISHIQFSKLLESNGLTSKQSEETSNESTYHNYTESIRSIALGDDGKCLYVGSEENVRTYDMEEIWQNIANVPQKWQNVDVESLTGLRYNASGKLTPFVPNHMIRVDNEEIIKNSSEAPTSSSRELTNQKEAPMSSSKELTNPQNVISNAPKDSSSNETEDFWQNVDLEEIKVIPEGLIKWHYDASNKSSPFIPEIIRAD